MSTKSNIILTDHLWYDLNGLTGVAVGTAIQIQNVSNSTVILFEDDTQPLADSVDGMQLLSPQYSELSKAEVSSGSKKIWVRLSPSHSKAILAVTE